MTKRLVVLAVACGFFGCESATVPPAKQVPQSGAIDMKPTNPVRVRLIDPGPCFDHGRQGYCLAIENCSGEQLENVRVCIRDPERREFALNVGRLRVLETWKSEDLFNEWKLYTSHTVTVSIAGYPQMVLAGMGADPNGGALRFVEKSLHPYQIE